MTSLCYNSAADWIQFRFKVVVQQKSKVNKCVGDSNIYTNQWLTEGMKMQWNLHFGRISTFFPFMWNNNNHVELEQLRTNTNKLHENLKLYSARVKFCFWNMLWDHRMLSPLTFLAVKEKIVFVEFNLFEDCISLLLVLLHCKKCYTWPVLSWDIWSLFMFTSCRKNTFEWDHIWKSAGMFTSKISQHHTDYLSCDLASQWFFAVWLTHHQGYTEWSDLHLTVM